MRLKLFLILGKSEARVLKKIVPKKKSVRRLFVDRKTLQVLQCIIRHNFTSSRKIVERYFANSFFFLSVHVCITIKISMHDARSRSEKISSTSIYHPTQFHVILSNSLAVFCKFHFFRSVHVCMSMKISMRDAGPSS